jgi:hypothetical protein
MKWEIPWKLSILPGWFLGKSDFISGNSDPRKFISWFWFIFTT